MRRRGVLGLVPPTLRRLDKQLQFATDCMLLLGAFALAYLLRFDFAVPATEVRSAFVQAPLVLLVQLAAAQICGIYTFIWRFVGLGELLAFARAGALSALPLLAMRLGLSDEYQSWRIPLSIIVLDTLLAYSSLLAARVLRRISYERWERSTSEAEASQRALIVGAGRSGIAIAREIRRKSSHYDLIGFVDDDPAKSDSVLYGRRVLGRSSDVGELIDEHGIDIVIFAITSAPRKLMRDLVETCEARLVPLKVIPGVEDLLTGTVEISRLRDIEIEDLLGREPVELDQSTLQRFLAGRRIMITGAGGSIGSEIARQALRFSPSSLLLVERAEFALFDTHRELQQLATDSALIPFVADVGDEGRIRHILTNYRPEIIVHAAAHKHVPLMEVNCTEAIKNNVLATRSLAQQAGELGVESFVLVSTDKAVNPTSVMGATKRLAELIILEHAARYANTRFLAVRFGNVMGSAGSVIPIFREQISHGGPITVTHPEMVRYFMTIPEASQLVLQAGSIGKGGEIFVLDMGEPVRIADLAEDMISLSGLKPHEDIDIVFTGARPGEKLFEELEIGGEDLERTSHPKIFTGRLMDDHETGAIERAVDELRELALLGLDNEIRAALNRLLPEAAVSSGSTESRREASTSSPS